MKRPWLPLAFILFCLALGRTEGRADEPDAPDTSRSEDAQKRFPQPVLVGALVGRTVLQPLESQPILGHVDRIVRDRGGAIKVVMSYGGFLGFGSRPIAVPVEAMALLGEYMEVVDLKPEQLATFPTFDGAGTTPVAKDDTIKVGLARPSH